MTNFRKKTTILATLALAALGVAGCSSEMTNNASPIELVVTNTQNLHRLDLDPLNGDQDCNQNIGTINLQAIQRNSEAPTGTSLQVRVTRYRVSYRRIDGGTLVPAPFVRSIDTLLTVGGGAQGSNFIIAQGDMFSQAPFAALLPQNGGRDPETGKTFVQFEVIVEVFGETLGGDRVYDSTRFPLEFCYACGGCS